MGLINQEALATIISILSSLSIIYRILSNNIIDKLTIFYNNRLKDDNNNLDTKVAPYALNIR
jgi:hypothetical protein